MSVEIMPSELTITRIALLHYYWGVQHTAVAHRSARADVNEEVEETIATLRALLARLFNCRLHEVPNGNGEDRCMSCRSR